jgi:hypothetical protein
MEVFKMTNNQKQLIKEFDRLLSKLSLECEKDDEFNEWLWERKVFARSIDEIDLNTEEE